MDEMKIFSGNSNRQLAEKICEYIGVQLGEIFVSRFIDGEICVKILENVRGKDTFVIQSTHPPAENLLELLIILDALKRASAKRITVVIPYYGYARQDKKDEPRTPISAKLVADLITTAGAHRILSMDLHAEQIQGFFNLPFDHLYAAPVIIEHINSMNFDLSELVIVSPDPGRAKRARGIAKRIGNMPIAIVDKRRPSPNQSEVMNIVGDVKNKTVILIDDIIDTGGTLAGAAKALKENGAKRIFSYVTHPLLSGDCLKKIEDSPIEKLVITDTIPLKNKNSQKIEVISVAKLLGEAIIRIHEERSVSTLFI
uniref:Ribose-phosphate pyrophosphokinase n=1 Tax=candidate division WOR-3 bacterium TaxID=2052148 RepID=A0A7C4U7A1_UNCW3